VAVLIAVRVSIANDVVFVVIDGEIAINLAVLIDSVVDAVLVGTEDGRIVFISPYSTMSSSTSSRFSRTRNELVRRSDG
jgi:Ni,Fe-hydrogenase maturation factor